MPFGKRNRNFLGSFPVLCLGQPLAKMEGEAVIKVGTQKTV